MPYGCGCGADAEGVCAVALVRLGVGVGVEVGEGEERGVSRRQLTHRVWLLSGLRRSGTCKGGE